MDTQFIEDCRELVKRPSISGQEKEAAAYLKTVMDRLGYDRTWIDEFGSAVGVIEGNGPGSVMLQGHVDTVGIVDRDKWQYDPFSAKIAEGRIYGRGTSDMKCALMAMVHGAADLIPRKNDLAGNIVVAGIVCEEAFEGVAQGRVLDQVDADLVVIGEASELSLNIGQRGRAEIVLVTHGKSAHSSNPAAGINAVKKMCRLLTELEALELPHDDFLGDAIMELTDIHSEPYPGASVIPARCRVTLDRRLLPGETEASVLAPLQAVISRMAAEDSEFSARAYLAEAEQVCYTGNRMSAKRFFPAWRFDPEAAFVKKAAAALSKAGLPVNISHYSFCTDGSQSAGTRQIPTIGFGPSRENLAHVVNEYVEIEQLEKARTGYAAIAAGMLTA